MPSFTPVLFVRKQKILWSKLIIFTKVLIISVRHTDLSLFFKNTSLPAELLVN